MGFEVLKIAPVLKKVSQMNTHKYARLTLNRRAGMVEASGITACRSARPLFATS